MRIIVLIMISFFGADISAIYRITAVKSTRDNAVASGYPGNGTEILGLSWSAIRGQRNQYPSGKMRSSKSGVNITDSRHLANDDPTNVNGKRLKVATLLWPPHTMIDRTNGELYGFCVDILSELSKLLNFSYTLELVEDGEFGVLKENGWSGVVGLLARKEVDMVAAPLTLHAARSKVMKFTFPFETKESKMWLMDPRGRQDRWIVLFDLLDLPSALLVCSAILILACLLTCTAYLLNRNSYNSLKWNYVTNVFQLFGVLLGQGLKRLPATEAGKVFLGCWWMFFITFSAMYSAILVATLSTNSTVLPFTTLDEVARQTDYTFGYLGGSVENLIFANSNRLDMQKAWRGIQEFQRSDPTVLSRNISVHFRKMIAEKYVYIGAKIPMLTDGMQLISLREVFHIYTNSFGLPLGSPYTNNISRGILTLREYGVIKRYRKKWWPRVSSRNVNNIKSASTISLRTVLGVFYTVTAGVALCVLVLLLEKAYVYLRTCRCQ